MILHLIEWNKFTNPLSNYLIADQRFADHHFLIISDDSIKDTNQKTIFRSPIRKNLFRNIKNFVCLTLKAEKIILHGPVFIHFLYFFPFVLKKAYWSINGYELGIIANDRNLYARMMRFVFRRVSGHLTHVKGDSDLANSILGSSNECIYAPMYLSNLVETSNFYFSNISQKDKINVLVGNSTDPTNNHLDIFDILEKQIDKIDTIYCPLSYGIFHEYKELVIKEGIKKFGNKFSALTEFMSIEEYSNFLKNIDVAIFNHRRQQAMGVTLSLLSLGKIVYLNANTTSYNSLKERGFCVFDIDLIEKDGINFNRNVSDNKELLQRYYSKEQLIDTYLNF